MRDRDEDAPEAGWYPAKGAMSSWQAAKQLFANDTPAQRVRLCTVRCSTTIARRALP